MSKKKANQRLPIFTIRLADLIHVSGMTVTDFAKSAGITRQAVNSYLNEGRIPDSETLKRICDAFNISADYLLGIVDQPTRDHDIRYICNYTGLNQWAIDSLHNKKMVIDATNEEIDGIKDIIDSLITTENGNHMLIAIYNYLTSNPEFFVEKEPENGIHVVKEFVKKDVYYESGHGLVQVTNGIIDKLHIDQIIDSLKSIKEQMYLHAEQDEAERLQGIAKLTNILNEEGETNGKS